MRKLLPKFGVRLKLRLIRMLILVLCRLRCLFAVRRIPFIVRILIISVVLLYVLMKKGCRVGVTLVVRCRCVLVAGW